MLPALAGFVQLPLPLRLNRAAHGGVRRFQFVKRLQPAAQAEGDDAGGEAAAADDARARTILVANFDGAEGDLRRVYGAFGAIESVDSGSGGKGIGRLVFCEAAAVDAVMRLTADGADRAAAAVADAEEELEDGGGGADGEGAEPPPTGVAKWLGEHFDARPGLPALQNYCDSVLAGYDERRKAAERAAEAARDVPDEDGFITVTRRARRNTHTDGTVQVKAASAGSAQAAERKLKQDGPNGAERTFSDFYRFQTRARREDELSSMRAKFEVDKQKIARAKALRLGRFQPY